MKKILFLLIILLVQSSVFAFEDIYVDERPPQIEQETDMQANTQSPEIIFNWNDITIEERKNLAEKYKNEIFSDPSKIYLDKKAFNTRFAKYKKDKEYKHHYMLVNNGITDDEEAKYSPFYYKKNTLIIYAIQYKNDFHNSLYYFGFGGKLYYVDITSNDYPNFPYYSMQYDKHGNLKSAIYFVSSDIQYMYNADKEFQGVWYKNQMLNLDAKQVSTREGW